MRLGIVGYRNYNNYEEFCKVVQYIIELYQQPEAIISGGHTDKYGNTKSGRHRGGSADTDGTDFLPVAGLSSVFNQVMALASNSRRPHMSQTQAGKLGTVTSSSSNQVK